MDSLPEKPTQSIIQPREESAVARQRQQWIHKPSAIVEELYYIDLNEPAKSRSRVILTVILTCFTHPCQLLFAERILRHGQYY